MIDIKILLEPDGTAKIEIRGSEAAEGPFRLYDISLDKFLTKRGWTKTASPLPEKAVRDADALVLALDAGLVRRMTAGAILSLEQPSSGFQQGFTWPGAAVVLPAPAAAVADETEAGSLSEIEKAADIEVEKAVLASSAEDAPKSLEPDVMAEHLPPEPSERSAAHLAGARPVESDRGESRPGLAFLAASGDRKQNWGLVAAAALLFLLLGMAVSMLVFNPSARSDVAVALKDSETLLEKERAAFKAQLAEAEAGAIKLSENKVKSAADQVSVLIGETEKLKIDRDAARKALEEKQASVDALTQKLKAATAEIDALNKTASDATKAQNAELTGKVDALTSQNAQFAAEKASLEEKVAALTAELETAQAQVPERDRALRDLQAKLSVANVQIDALKLLAAKSTEATLEKASLADKVTELTADLDKSGRDLADKEKALVDTNAKLAEMSTKLADANARAAAVSTTEQPVSGQEVASTDVVTSDVPAGFEGIKEERDLYEKELSVLTDKFAALQAEKTTLEDSLKALKAEADSKNKTATNAGKAIWGATAIDEGGTIYALQNQTVEKAATDNVVAICRGKSRFRCEALSTYSNKCFSVARFKGEGPANDNYAFAVHQDYKTSAAQAMAKCENMGGACSIRFTACSPDGLTKPAAEQ